MEKDYTQFSKKKHRKGPQNSNKVPYKTIKCNLSTIIERKILDQSGRLITHPRPSNIRNEILNNK